jgi:hypothetical protein
MQLRKSSAFVLFVGSYLPLAVVLLAQDLDLKVITEPACSPDAWITDRCELPLQHPAWSISFVVVGLMCALATLITLKLVKLTHRITIVESKHIPADLINYVMPYIVSFMGLDYSSPSKLIGFAVFFVWIFWITYQSGQIMMNPLLIAFGWKLYEVKYSYLQSDSALVGRALAQGDIEPNTLYRRGNLQDVIVVDELGEQGEDGQSS